ncbi:MAG: hypothetical protein MZV70_63405 [Desulfobacterales bacterium]|nr:hypothetical protein [Desulfobacterales bacterium]
MALVSAGGASPAATRRAKFGDRRITRKHVAVFRATVWCTDRERRAANPGIRDAAKMRDRRPGFEPLLTTGGCDDCVAYALRSVVAIGRIRFARRRRAEVPASLSLPASPGDGSRAAATPAR